MTSSTCSSCAFLADLLPPYEPPKTTTGAASAERFFFRLLMRMAKSASACVDVR